METVRAHNIAMAIVFAVLICPCSSARVKHNSSVEAEPNADDLINEYYDTSMGIAFTMIEKTSSWQFGWGLSGHPGGNNKWISIMTHAQDMSTYQGDSYGLAFHITPSSDFWKYFHVIKKGSKAGKIRAGPGDGGSHTPDHEEWVHRSAMGKDYEWFKNEKDEILAKYNTVYGIHDYNEFITSGTSKSALAGILHYTLSHKGAPSDEQMCRLLLRVRNGRWPIYAYDRTSLKIERYLTC